MTIALIDIFNFCQGGSGGGFSPSSRGAQLAIWLQGSTLTQSGGLVTTWPDSSGNWTAATPNAVAPAYTASNAAYNNRPTATYVSASAQQLRVSAFTVSQPNTIYLVCNDTLGAASNAIDGGTSRQIVGWNTDWYCFASASITSSVSSFGPHAIATVFNGASSAMYIDSSSVSVASGNPGASAVTGGLLIGSSAGGGSAITGSIAEIIITNVADTLAQRAAMFGYFAAKYAGAWA